MNYQLILANKIDFMFWNIHSLFLWICSFTSFFL